MSSVPYPTGKKTACLIAPLGHYGLKRIHQQVYLGRIQHELDPDDSGNLRYVFATPHGLLLMAAHAQLQEPTAEEYRELDGLEEKATETNKVFYGGEPALLAFIKSCKIPKK